MFLVLGRLASFYETVVPEMEKAVRKRNFDNKRLVCLLGCASLWVWERGGLRV